MKERRINKLRRRGYGQRNFVGVVDVQAIVS